MNAAQPLGRIRTSALLAVFSLCWVIGDLWKIRRLAGDALTAQREERDRHARELNDLDDAHRERIAEIRAEVDAEVHREPPAA